MRTVQCFFIAVFGIGLLGNLAGLVIAMIHGRPLDLIFHLTFAVFAGFLLLMEVRRP